MATSPLPSGEEVLRHLQVLLADLLGRRGEEVHLAAFLGDAGVERDDGDAAFHRLLQRGNESVGVVRRNRDGVDALRDQRVDDLDLAFRRRRVGPV